MYKSNQYKLIEVIMYWYTDNNLKITMFNDIHEAEHHTSHNKFSNREIQFNNDKSCILTNNPAIIKLDSICTLKLYYE